MPITEEQRQRAEANRLAAIAKRKAFTDQQQQQQQQAQQIQNPWRLFKCQKLTSTTHLPKPPPFLPVNPDLDTLLAQKFRVRLEICSPDSFSVIPEAVQGFVYPGQEECLKILGDCLSNVIPSHYTQNYGGGKACVFKIRDYDAVLTSLKNCRGIEIQKVPFGTLNVIQRLSHSFDTKRWEPCRPEHLTDEAVNAMIAKLPRKLLDTLLPFQIDGLRFGLQRGGRCLIADEMGLGKTLQAIAIAGCFMSEGPILVVCPAILRFSWAEELERWLPSCLPSDVHLVFGHQNNPKSLTRLPKVVVISYTMLHRLRKSMLDQEWALLIVDESHHVRSSKNKEAGEVKAVLDVAAKVKRIVLLSGTPSLSRPYDIFHQINMLWPGLLGQSKYDFAKTYCNVRVVQTSEGKGFQDFSKGIRLEELNVLLKQTVMIRRLKEHVLQQLPPKRRQIIRLLLKRSDIVSAKAATGVSDVDASESNAGEAIDPKKLDEPDDNRNIYKSWKLSRQELGIAKLSGFLQWLSIHPLISEPDGLAEMDVNTSSQKMLIFAHHLKVLNGVQEFICEKRVPFIRIDGNTLARDRQLAVQSFQSSNEVKIAIIGITAGGVGLNFSAAQNVVFLELPDSPSLMLQAEDRAHRQGQTKAVNIYIFCAKDTIDETHWQSLNKSLHCVSSTTNGKYDAMREIVVDSVSYLKASGKAGSSAEHVLEKASCVKLCTKECTKLPDSGLFVDRRPLEMHDEVARKLIDISEEEGSVALDLEIDKDSAGDGNLERNIFGTEIEIHERDSSNLDEGKRGKDQSITDSNCSLQETKLEFGTSALPNEANEECSNHANFLRFEVSQYTGRIHLYSCNPGTDSRPQPLFENFRLEEIESLHSQNQNKETCPRTFKGNPLYWHALLAFISEWNKLRPIEKRKLCGKTLQLPLTTELCYLNESINHNTGGLLKGGSKRRVTPLSEISCPLPPDTIWKKVYLSSGFGKKEKQYTQGWTVMDEPLCKLCQKPCMGDNAKTPEYFEDLFCNLRCYEEYRVRTSSRSLRQELFKIEHGICTNCQLDCHQLVRTIKPLSLRRRREYIEEVAPKLASRKKLLDKLVNDPSEANAWHADHIVPVYRGGGECNLENMRTLCVACHYEVTKSQHAERGITMAKARKLLKDSMRRFELLQEMEKVDSNFKFQGRVDPMMQQDPVDDELLVKVPGSAYSRGKDIDPGSEGLRSSIAEERQETVTK